MAGTYIYIHTRDMNADPRLPLTLRTILVVLATRLMMPVLLNNHSGSIMMPVLVLLTPGLMMPVLLNNDGGSVMMLLRVRGADE